MAAASQPLPLTLRVVAIIALAQGIWSLIEVVGAALHGNVDLDFGVLGIFACIGLFRLSNGWRIYMLVCTWVGLIGVPFLLLLGWSGVDVKVSLLGSALGHVDFIGLVIYAILFMAYFLWQYSVLTRSDVVRLFQQKTLSLAEFHERARQEGRGL